MCLMNFFPQHHPQQSNLASQSFYAHNAEREKNNARKSLFSLLFEDVDKMKSERTISSQKGACWVGGDRDGV